MDFQKRLIPYDIHQQYVTGNRRGVFHSFADWGSELVIIFNGSALYCVDDRIFPVERGNIFLLTGDYIKEIFDAKQLSICSIFFHEEHIERSAALFRHLVGYQKFFVENPMQQKFKEQDRIKVSETEIQDIEILISHMVVEWQAGAIGSEQMLNSMFFILITMISRAYSTNVFFNTDPGDAITEAVSYMRCHYTENLTLGKIATMAYVSPRHFDRKFKEIYHISPIKYIRKLRLAHACLLLEQSNLSVAQIAMECGFTDINYFSKLFRKAYQVNPSNFRKIQLSSVPNTKPDSLRPKFN